MATERQALLPGYGTVNETQPPNNKEALLPGFGTLNETVEAAAGGWTGTVNGVVNPSAVNSVLAADITNVIGVT